MSVKNEEQKLLEEKVVVNEVESTELGTVEVEIETKEAKKAKFKKGAKKVGTFLGILGLGTLIGYACGSKSSKKDDEYYNESEVVEGEIVDSDIE